VVIDNYPEGQAEELKAVNDTVPKRPGAAEDELRR
jgi:hypothetical protein